MTNTEKKEQFKNYTKDRKRSNKDNILKERKRK